MPPKRKRADETAAAATRATRSSSRGKTADSAPSVASTSTAGDAASTPAAIVTIGGEGTEPPPTKKGRTTKKGTTAKGKGKGKTQAGANEGVNDNEPSTSNNAKPTKPAEASTEPYTSAGAAALFSDYTDEDDANVIGPEGFERLCSEMQISLEGALPLILAWQMNASEMAKITKEEWQKGMEQLQIASLHNLALALHELENMMIFNKEPLKLSAAPPAHGKKKAASHEPYNRARYRTYALDVPKAFSELYYFCFNLAKPAGARNIDMETASAFWSVLVAPQYPVMKEILDFINEKGCYKGVNKDLWSMTLEFCRTVQSDLSTYDADGAWPTMIDNFVEWKTSKNKTIAEHVH